MTVGNKEYIQVSGWMINELGLKGNELWTYGLIFGFTMARGQRFFGNIQYIADWLNTSKRTVHNVLNSLIEKGLIIKDEEEYHEHVFAYYRVNPEFVYNDAAGGEEEKEEAALPVKQERAKKKEKEEQEREKLFCEFANQFSFVEHTREDLISTLNDFVEARRQSNNKMNDLAIKRHLNRLYGFSKGDGDKAIKILDNSIRNGWTDIYELKDYGKGRKQPESRPASSDDGSDDELADLTAKLAEMGYKFNEAKCEPEAFMLRQAIEYESSLNSYLADGYLIKI